MSIFAVVTAYKSSHSRFGEDIMKAMIYREFGPPDVLHYEDVPDPVAGPGEIVLEVHACSVNRVLDVAVRAGKQPQRNVQLPHVGGVDPGGIVTAVGPGVTD